MCHPFFAAFRRVFSPRVRFSGKSYRDRSRICREKVALDRKWPVTGSDRPRRFVVNAGNIHYLTATTLHANAGDAIAVPLHRNLGLAHFLFFARVRRRTFRHHMLQRMEWLGLRLHRYDRHLKSLVLGGDRGGRERNKRFSSEQCHWEYRGCRRWTGSGNQPTP